MAILQEVKQLGQQIWLDNLSRSLVRSGTLAKLQQSGVSGVTSNPAIFRQALAGDALYTAEIAQLKQQPLSAKARYETLAVADVQAACDEARAVPGSDQREEVAPVNFNAPSQVVIAGHVGAVKRACEAAQARGARRAVVLPVSAPFHSVLLKPAGEVLQRALADIDLKAPAIPLVNNVDVAFETDPARIRDALVRQAWHPVRWVEVIQALADKGVDQFVEFGPGKVLTGLIKRIAPQAQLLNVSDAASLQSTLAKFS